MARQISGREEMKISVMQPHFVPYPGLFDLINQVDLFVFYDCAKFERCSWQTRNRIKTDRGWEFITVPVKNPKKTQRIMDVEIDYSKDWITNHLKTLEHCYRKATFYRDYIFDIKRIYHIRPHLLESLNNIFMLHFLKTLNIETQIEYTHGIGLEEVEGRTEKLIEVCKHFEATEYVSSPMGRSLYKEEDFKKHGIKLSWYEYHNAVYPQVKHGNIKQFFIPELSILDMIFNCGIYTEKIIKGEKDE
jgi:hypothetical protein